MHDLPEQLGITPARAGKSLITQTASCAGWDHPRACGEKQQPNMMQQFQQGSPPRVRGKVKRRRVFLYHDGITPARAGKRASGTLVFVAAGDHPRACGEKAVLAHDVLIQVGSPPRVRGKDWVDQSAWVHRGITPARAGKSPPDNRQDAK